MAPTTTPVNFKLHLAPGAVEKFTINFKNRAFDEFIDNLELKLGELGLTLNVVFWKNDKGNLISLSDTARKMLSSNENSEHISLYAIADSSAYNSSDSSSGESGDEIVVIASPKQPNPRRRCGRRDRSRSRGFDRSRSRSHSHGHGRGLRGLGGPKGHCARKRLAHLEKRVELLEVQSARRGRPCAGRRARSASPTRRGLPGFEFPPFGRGFGRFGEHEFPGHGPHGPHGHGPRGFGPHGHGPHGHGPYGRHHFGPFGGHHGFAGHHGFVDARRAHCGFGRSERCWIPWTTLTNCTLI